MRFHCINIHAAVILYHYAIIRDIVANHPETKNCPEHGNINEEWEGKLDTIILINTAGQYVWIEITCGTK